MTPTLTGVRLQLHVQPRASRTESAGLHGDALKIRLAAPPVDGAANDALLRWLARALKLPARDVVLTAGDSSCRKVVVVEGVTVAAVVESLGAPIEADSARG